MKLIKIPLSEAIEKNLPMDFEITEDLYKQSLPQLEASLREHGWKGPSKVVSNNKTGVSGNSNVEIGDGDLE